MVAMFIDYFPASNGPEVEKLRLLLSTFQDGSGMLKAKQREKYSLPGFRDFERSIAVLVGGSTGEDKHVFDVHLESTTSGLYYGYSCKMRGTLRDSDRRGDATIEVTNAANALWTGLKKNKIDEDALKAADPLTVGRILIATVESWYISVDHRKGGSFIVENSPMLHLAYDRSKRLYQLFCFLKHIPNLKEIESFQWKILGKQVKGLRPDGSRGIEWYFGSGGQLKYYPKLEEAVWKSDRFMLEDLPEPDNGEDVLAAKAASYFGEKWQAVILGVSSVNRNPLEEHQA